MKIYCMPRGEKDGSSAVYSLLGRAVLLEYGIEIPKIEKTDAGKPYFPERPDIYFSVSHTSSHVLCAVSDTPVGVDVEKVRPIKARVPRRVCAASELESFDFFDLWVLKESYIKLQGGISVPLRDIRFSRRDGIILTPGNGVSASLLNGIPGCRAAVCWLGGAVSNSLEYVDPGEFFPTAQSPV